MYSVELQFANLTENMLFASETAARIYAGNLGDMFDAEEVWLNKDRKCFIVSVPTMEIVK